MAGNSDKDVLDRSGKSARYDTKWARGEGQKGGAPRGGVLATAPGGQFIGGVV